MKTIAIRCTAAINLDLTDLTPLQGELKALSKQSFEKLKRSILKHGIIRDGWTERVPSPALPAAMSCPLGSRSTGTATMQRSMPCSTGITAARCRAQKQQGWQSGRMTSLLESWSLPGAQTDISPVGIS